MGFKEAVQINLYTQYLHGGDPLDSDIDYCDSHHIMNAVVDTPSRFFFSDRVVLELICYRTIADQLKYERVIQLEGWKCFWMDNWLWSFPFYLADPGLKQQQQQQA